MSGPFVYTQPTTVAYPHQYQQQPYYVQSTPSAPSTPFVPNLALYHGSPYSNPPMSLPPSPRMLPATIPFPVSAPAADREFIPTWPPAYARERRPSWHAHAVPWLPPSPTYPFGATPLPPTHGRRHSFSASPYDTSPYVNPAFYINPWLNGESPRHDFMFDLSSATFAPMRLYGPGQLGPLSQEELVQPATHPPVYRMRIICDLIPQWPLELAPNEYMSAAGGPYQIPPIALVDVLVALHRHLHRQISHADWARLSRHEESAIAKAYTARCRAAQSTSELESTQGVKRVDYFLGRTKFIGLVRQQPADGFEVMKLYVRQ